jgi:hypothetical protein
LKPALEANALDGVAGRGQAWARAWSRSRKPVVNFDFRLDLAVAVPPLQDTDKFFRFAAQSGEILISELAPTAVSPGL